MLLIKKIQSNVDTTLTVLCDYIEGIYKRNYQTNLVVFENKTKQKKQSKKASISLKPKGDLEMKNVYYRPADKRYTGIKQIKGTKIRVYGPTQQICAQNLRDAVKAFYVGVKKAKPPKVNHITVLYVFEKWYNEYMVNTIAESTKSEILRIKGRLAPLHNVKAKLLTKQMILNYLDTQPANRSREKLITYFKASLRFAQNEGLIAVNPFTNMRLEPKKNTTREAFSYDEQKRILAALPDTEIYIHIMLYLLTGLRKNELNTSDIENDIDFQSGILRAVNLKGKYKKVRYKQIKLSPEFTKMVASNLDALKKYSVPQIYIRFAALMKALKIKGSIVNLRHTYATNNLYLGNSDVIVSKQMGHSTSQITKDVYMNIDHNLSKQKIIQLYGNLYPLFD